MSATKPPHRLADFAVHAAITRMEVNSMVYNHRRPTITPRSGPMLKMLKTRTMTFVFAIGMGLSASLPAAASCPAASPAEVRVAVDKLNAEGLDAFRSVSMSEHRTFALSPVVRWYARHFATRAARAKCSREHQADLALFSELERAPGRYFGSSVASGPPLRAVVVFAQNATLDESSFASFTPTVLPSFNDTQGTLGIRLDSSTGRLSLYLFDGTLGGVSPTIPRFQARLDQAMWKQIRAQFVSKRVSRGVGYVFLDGTSLFSGSYGVATERVDLALGSTDMHLLATIDTNDTAANKPNPIFGRMEPWGQTLWVLIDSQTGAILDIGANIEETEP